MKFLVIFMLSLLSTAALACPNLAGEFQCYDDEEGYYTTKISQTGTGENTIYTALSENETDVIRANNQWDNTVQDGQTVKTKARCSGNTVIIDLEANEANVGLVKINVKMNLNASNDLVGTTTLNIGGFNFPSETSTCTRM